MLDFLDYAGRGTAILFALALTGCSFLLWARSKGAALFGALAGLSTLFSEIVFIVLGFLVRSGGYPRGTISLLFATTSTMQAVGTYVPLAAMAILLARSGARR